jgi:gamma-glutamylcyclotransferase (GGCT)/AIG2-like uncharacterized protein YtfP
MNNKYFYFAYGSNMSKEQMKKRCPDAKPLGKAILKGYKFIINNRGVATVIESKDDYVEGGLYEVTNDCLKSLNKYEGVSLGYYYKRKLQVEYENETIEAYIYIATCEKESKNPRQDYMKTVLTGAKDFNLSDDYIKMYLEIYK